MPAHHCSDAQSFGQKSHPTIPLQKNITAILEEGVHYDTVVGEYFIVICGEIRAWSGDYGQAVRSYHEMLRIDREHYTRNRSNRMAVLQ